MLIKKYSRLAILALLCWFAAPVLSAQADDAPLYPAVSVSDIEDPGANGVLVAAPVDASLPDAVATNDAQAPGQYGPVKVSDHLWKIARNVRTDKSLTLSQVMTAIYKNNPHAFNKGNIQSLKVGAILKIPAQEEMQQISSGSANTATADGATLKGNAAGARTQQQELQRLLNKAKIVAPKSVIKTQIAKTTMEEPAVKIAATPAPAVVADVAQLHNDVSLLQGQLQVLSQNLQIYNQQANIELNNVKMSNFNLQEKVVLLNAQVDTQAQELHTLKLQQQKLAHYLPYRIFNKIVIANHYLKQKFGVVGFVTLWLALLLVSILTLVWMLKPMAKKSATTERESVLPEEALEPVVSDLASDEYDFLASPEGVPAKLDLARAYIEMGEHDSAKHALEEVLRQGDAEQQRQAEELLQKLSEK